MKRGEGFGKVALARAHQVGMRRRHLHVPRQPRSTA
jgi:hypothetical protein